MGSSVVVEGSVFEPVAWVRVPWSDARLRTALSRDAGCRWDAEGKRWLVGARDLPGWCKRLGLGLDVSDAPAGLDVLCAPVVWRVPGSSGVRARVAVDPRLAGLGFVCSSVAPDDVVDGSGWPVTDVLNLCDGSGALRTDVVLGDASLAEDALEAYRVRVAGVHAGLAPDEDGALVARGASLEDGATRAAALRVASALGWTDRAGCDVWGVPQWFGYELAGSQVLGALALGAGRCLLADDMGVGKTVEALAWLAMSGFSRMVVVSPPGVSGVWGEHVAQSGLAVVSTVKGAGVPKWLAAEWGDVSRAGSPGAAGASLAVFRAGAKAPVLPVSGVVVVADSLLGRSDVVEALVGWSAQAVVVDEAHHFRSWGSKRSQGLLRLCSGLRERDAGVRVVCATGTPMPSGCGTDVVPLLSASGVLDWLGGPRWVFCDRFARRGWFGGWAPKPDMAATLRDLLWEWVWVRRVKADVLDLPGKVRTVVPVDAVGRDYADAMEALGQQVRGWAEAAVRATGVWPGADECRAWAEANMGLMSRLRIGSALGKMPWVSDWLDEHFGDAGVDRRDGDGGWVSPVVVWCWHREVIDAVVGRVGALGVKRKWWKASDVGVIDGRSSSSARAGVVSAFQAGRVPVLVCQISAAGVGLTLTRSSDVVFVESDWLADSNTQAEDRCDRRGQERLVSVWVLRIPGTVDDHVLHVSGRRGRSGQAVVGGEGWSWAGSDVSPVAVLAGLAEEVVRDMRQQKLC